MGAAATPTLALFGGGDHTGVGRVTTVDIFNATSGAWTTAALTNPLMELAAASTARKVIFAGGTSLSGAVLRSADVYDIASGTWSYVPTALTEGRTLLTGVGTPSKAFFAGGNGATMYRTVDIYDDATGTWSNTSMPGGGRSALASVAVGNLVFFAGGTFPFWTPLATVDIYDVSTSSWRPVTAMGVPRFGLAATSLAGRYALFGGGCVQASGSPGAGPGTTAVEIYDTVTGTMGTLVPGLSVPRYWLAAASTGNLAVFAGGVTSGSPVTTVDVFNLASGLWTSSVGALSAARGLLSAVSVNGSVLFAGGAAGFSAGPAYANVDRFLPSDGVNGAQPSSLTTLAAATTTASTTSTAAAATSLLATSQLASISLTTLSATVAAASVASTTAVATSTTVAASTAAVSTSLQTTSLSTTASVTALATTVVASVASQATLTAAAVTSTNARAVSLGAESAARSATTVTAASASSTSAPVTPPASAPPPITVYIDGTVQVDGPWTATPTQVTLFTGNGSSTALARLTVNGTATLAGDAVVYLPSVLTDTQRVRLVLGTQVNGAFNGVRVQGPPGDCNRYTAHPLVLSTLYALDVTAAPAQCPVPTDRLVIIAGALIGALFAATIIVTIVGWALSTWRPDLLPAWLVHRRIGSNAYLDLNDY